MRRKPMKEALRRSVYEKYHGRCAYCGSPITYQEMQVDHIVALANGGTNDLSNLNPSCPLCNTFKGDSSIKSFRRRLKTLTHKLREKQPFHIALHYGLLVEDKKKYPIKFYFERVKHK